MRGKAPRLMKTLLRICTVAVLITITVPVRAQTVDEILHRMMARNEWQDRALLEFKAHRRFYAMNARFKTDSTMYVQTVFRHPRAIGPEGIELSSSRR